MKQLVCLLVCLACTGGLAQFSYYTHGGQPYYSLGYAPQTNFASSAPWLNPNTFYYLKPTLDENMVTGSYKFDPTRSRNARNFLKSTGSSDEEVDSYLNSELVATLDAKDGIIKYKESSDGTAYIDVELEHGKEISYVDTFTNMNVKMIAHILGPYTIRLDTLEENGQVTSTDWSFCSGGTYATIKLMKKDDPTINQAFFFYSREGNELKLNKDNQQVLCPGQGFF